MNRLKVRDLTPPPHVPQHSGVLPDQPDVHQFAGVMKLTNPLPQSKVLGQWPGDGHLQLFENVTPYGLHHELDDIFNVRGHGVQDLGEARGGYKRDVAR